MTEDLKVTPRFIYFIIEQDFTDAEPGLICYQQRHLTNEKRKEKWIQWPRSYGDTKDGAKLYESVCYIC